MRKDIITCRVEHFPGSFFKNKDGSYTVSELVKSYDYYGNLINVRIDKTIRHIHTNHTIAGDL